MTIAVNGYALSWNIAAKNGAIFLHLANNQQGQIAVGSSQELADLSEILRHSPNVGYDPQTGVLSTAVKPPGS